MITIEGLTKKQKAMLKIMWSIDSKEQLYYWVNSLNKNDRATVSSLLIILQQEIMEEFLDDECEEAKEVLSKFSSF